MKKVASFLGGLLRRCLAGIARSGTGALAAGRIARPPRRCLAGAAVGCLGGVATRCLAAVAAGFFAGGVFGADLYVSPTGSPDGAGTRERPWDLASTLEGRRAVGPGDTIYLLGGTYRRRPDAEFAVRLRGEPERPIHVRPAPRERAAIDGGLAIEEPSSHVWLWDLEVLVSENFTLSREIEELGSNPSAYGRPWGGVHLRGGRSAKLIHLTIHDCAQGVSAWSSAIEAEIYGCLIYDNGWKAPDRGHGHAIYTQNEKGTKVIRHSILSAKYEGSYTLHAYGSSRAYVDDYLVEENIAYGLGPFLIGGGRPSRAIRVIGNALWGVDLRLGYDAPYNEDCVVRDNVVGRGSIAISRFRSVVAEGNLELERAEARRKLPVARWFPSRYEPSRAHLAVFAESEKEREEIPARPFLSPGDRYRLFDPKDFLGNPVAQGTCEGDRIQVPVRGGFAAYVVLREGPARAPSAEER